MLPNNQSIDNLYKAFKKEIPPSVDLRSYLRHKQCMKEEKRERERSIEDVRDIGKFEEKMKDSIFNQNETFDSVEVSNVQTTTNKK